MSEPEKPKRGRPSTMNAEKVLDAAMQAYWESDPADVSINMICQLAEVSKPALYREFGSEDGLMAAVLNRYTDLVLSDISKILAKDMPVQDTFEALTYFASGDPKMETGCVFYKMRAGKHRLGPKTHTLIQAVDAGAVDAFVTYLESRRAQGEWSNPMSAPLAARYLVEQIGLALTQRAAGEDKTQVRDTLVLALKAIQ